MNKIQIPFLITCFSFLAIFSSLRANVDADSITKVIPGIPVIPIDSIQVLSVAKFTNKACLYDSKNSGKNEKLKKYDTVVSPQEYVMVIIDHRFVSLAEQKKDSLRLWINGVCYPKIKPAFINRTNSAIIFKLDVDTAKTSPWQLFYSYPSYWTFERNVSFNLGTQTKEFKAQSCKVMVIKLKTSETWMAVLGYSLFLFILISILWFCKGIIRDVAIYAQKGVTISYKPSQPTDANTQTIYIRDIPFSIARTQFLFWLLIIFLSIIHIWVIRDILSNPTGTVLMLLGISGGTFYIGKIIDKTNIAKTETAATATETAATETETATKTEKEIEIKKATEFVQKFKDDDLKSKGFVIDILSDGKAISLHRLQFFMFTLFLGIYFLCQVLCYLGMPQFSDTMMLLMGISSGTYAGIKTTE